MIPDDFWPTKKELLKTRPYLADPSTGHPLCSFVRDPNEVLDILDRSWRKPFTVSNYQFFHDLLAWYQKSWTFHMVGERFFGFWSDCFWILPTISPFESWMYLCFLVNIKKINSIFPRTFASCSITHHHHPFRWCLLTVSGSVFFFSPCHCPHVAPRSNNAISLFQRRNSRQHAGRVGCPPRLDPSGPLAWGIQCIYWVIFISDYISPFGHLAEKPAPTELLDFIQQTCWICWNFSEIPGIDEVRRLGD